MYGDYLVVEYFEDDDKPRLFRVSQVELWKLLDEAKESGRLISVYEIGECVLDWS